MATGGSDLSETESRALESGDDVAVQIAIARRYYHRDESKVAIAKAFGLSRFQVARLLQDARRDGLVRIEIGAPGSRDRELAAALQERLGLAKAVVVASAPSSPHMAVEYVGRALAEEVAAAVKAGDALGVAWSSTTVAMADALAQLRPCSVVQLAGAIYPPAGVPGSVEITRRLAQVARGDAHTIYAPLVVADAETAGGLLRQPEIDDVLKRARSLDLAVMSVGAWHPSASAVYDLLSPQEQEEIAAAGACGEISGRLFDTAGRIVAASLSERVIGVTAEELQAVPHRIVSSHGAFRAEATRAAVRAGLVHTLVVDSELAAALLETA
ncbi:sugar-binding transcriptional regulator [Streptomonospora arabica]|uniref:Sugar-binding transcriptional regulator n=1 Tax=Streptomonospora arabica TaxID=412417 RepID=A0ABV9SH72_9ACTN